MSPATTPPAYVATVEREAARHKVPAKLIAAIVMRESRWDTFAIGAAGERGIAQILPATARELCPFEARLLHWPQPALSCLARILRWHKRRCGTWLAAASAYNGSRKVCGTTNYGQAILASIERERQ